MKYHRIVLPFIVLLFSSALPAQEKIETLFDGDMNMRYVWGFESRTMSIQRSIGTSIGVSAGLVLDGSIIAGISAASNLTHSTVNHGYAGIYATYVFNASKVLHWNATLLLGSGAVKDYEQAKTNAFDNFVNVFGAGYYFIEPGMNAEINASTAVRIITGISYRLVSGMESRHPTVVLYRPTNSDLSGLNWNLSLRFE